MKAPILLFILQTASFHLSAQSYVPGAHDVVITEIMADPTPSAGLPLVEYIEIRNTSGRSLQLSGWRLRTATASTGVLRTHLLLADSILMLGST